MKKGVLILLISLVGCGMAYSQTVEPPTDSDEFGWLRWAVIVLLGIVISGSATLFAFMKKSFEDRLADKNAEIVRLELIISNIRSDDSAEYARLNKRIDELTAQKDAIYRDMQEKVIPALVSASDLIRTFLHQNNYGGQ